MADVKILSIPAPEPGVLPVYDIDVTGADLTADDGLETAVIISLFTDRRAEPDDPLPDESRDRRGWWADAYSKVDGDKIGSRLWLLSREKQLQSVVNRAQQYAEEALAWMIEDGIARNVEVEAEIIRTGVLGLGITIERSNQSLDKYSFEVFWKGA